MLCSGLLLILGSTQLLKERSVLLNHAVAIVRNHDLYLAKGSGTILSRLTKNVDDFEWSPDGKLIAVRSGPNLALLNLTTNTSRHLNLTAPSDSDIFRVGFTFDRKQPSLVIGGLGQKLVRVSLANRSFGLVKEFLVSRHYDTSAVAWSHDGNKLAFTRDGDVWLAAREGATGQYYDHANRIAALAVFNDVELGASASTPFWVDGLRWTKDDKRILFHFQRQFGSGVSELGWLNLSKGNPNSWSDFGGTHTTIHRIAFKGDPLVWSPDITPDGRAITVSVVNASTSRNLELVSWDGKHRTILIKDVEAALWRPY